MPKLSEKLTDTIIKRLPLPAKGNVLHYAPPSSGGTRPVVIAIGT